MESKHTPGTMDGADVVIENQARALVAHARKIDALTAQRDELLAALDRANRLLAELTFTAWIKGDDAASIDMRQRIKGAHEAAAAAIARAEGGR